MFAGNLKLTKSAPVSTPDTTGQGRASAVRIPCNMGVPPVIFRRRMGVPPEPGSSTIREASCLDENSRKSDRGQQNNLLDFFGA